MTFSSLPFLCVLIDVSARDCVRLGVRHQLTLVLPTKKNCRQRHGAGASSSTKIDEKKVLLEHGVESGYTPGAQRNILHFVEMALGLRHPQSPLKALFLALIDGWGPADRYLNGWHSTKFETANQQPSLTPTSVQMAHVDE